MPEPNPWGQPPEREPQKPRWLLWLGALLVLVILLILLSRAFPGGQDALTSPDLIQTVAVLALVSSSLLFVRQFKFKETVRNVLLWVGVGGVLLTGFAFQEELFALGRRLRAEIVPGYPTQTAANEMVISANDGGGFHVYGAVNSVPIRFLVDTGASSIVLSPADAKKLGLDLGTLTFNRPYETANGIGYGASAEVDELTVGHIHLSNVPVSINGAPMSSSLLGMTFLNRMKSFSITGRKLVLRY